MTINELIRDAYAIALAHGWHDTPRTFPESLLLLVSEISEATEEYREHHALTEVYYRVDGKPEGIPIELADLIIRVADLCGEYDIDLEDALQIKMKYNEKREWRHGGKKL